MVGKVKYSILFGRDNLKSELVLERFTYNERAVHQGLTLLQVVASLETNTNRNF